jgi:nitrate/nitrite transport system ATP-binding protein
MAFLEVTNVHKGYGPAWQRTEVLADINLQIEEGEFVAIVGYSGAGKTTLMSLLAGLLRPDTGAVRLAGKEMAGPGPDRGLVFQNYSLLPWLTVYENVALAVDQVFPDWTAARRKEHTEKFIAMVNLTPALKKVPRELSGGMRQRVSVARTLAINPRVLLLDEPLGALDALTRANLQDEISKLWQEDRKTVVLITNDPDEAIYLADRVIPLTAGPRATLGPSIPVTLPRPRQRRTLAENFDFKNTRFELVDYLLKARPRDRVGVTRRLVLPDLQPEDISVARPTVTFGARARRTGETRSVTVDNPVR